MEFLKKIGSVFGNAVFFGLMLFLPAGTIRWWPAWVFLVVVAIASTATMSVVSDQLIDERYKSPVQKGQPIADKFLTLALILGFVGFVVFIPLDVFRFQLFAPPPLSVSIIGLAIFISGWTIMTLSFRENSFAAPVVKHQAEREQRVIDSGVYAHVRHPLYAGAIPVMIGMPLWLGSYAGALIALVPIAILVVRVGVEEKFLRRELGGYSSYADRVRYRLVPYVW